MIPTEVAGGRTPASTVALRHTVEDPDWWLRLWKRNGSVHQGAAVRCFRGARVRSKPNAPRPFHLALARHSESPCAPLPTLSRAAA
jgi:hypothetical protein